MTRAGKSPAIRSIQAKAALPEESIDHLGRHIDRRLTALETEVKSLRTDMAQGFEKVDQ